jgi:WD40 repeat protein
MMIFFLRLASPILALLCSANSLVVALPQTEPAAAAPAPSVSFSADVASILHENCVACHCAKKSEGGYRLDTFHDLMQPGDSSESPIVAKSPGTSVMLQRIIATDPSVRMPPEHQPLAAEQVEKIKNWILAGAEFDGKDAKQHLALVGPAKRYPNPPDTYPPVPLTALAFSSDGSKLICGGYHELTIWDTSNGQLSRRIGNLGQRIFSIAFAPDGNLIAVACGEPGKSGEVRLVDFGSGEVVGVIGRSTDVILDVAFRPNRDELAIACADNSVRLFNYKTMEQVRAYSSHADWVTALAFSADGNRLVSASRDKSAKVFDLESGQMLINYAGHATPVRGVAFGSDGNQVVSVADDKKLHIWMVADAKKTAEVALEGEGFRLTRRDGFVLVPGASRRVVKIDLASNKIVQAYAGHSDWLLSSAIAADGRVAGGGIDGQIRIWAVDGTLLHHWIAAPQPATK